MKFRYYLLLFIAFALLLFNCTPKIQPEPNTGKLAESAIEVIVPEELVKKAESRSPDKVPIYPVLKNDPGRSIYRFAKVVRIESDIKAPGGLLTLQDENSYMEVRRISNAVFYNNIKALWTQEPSPEKQDFNLPSNEEIKKLTYGWLGNVGFSHEQLKDVDISISDELFELTLPEAPNKPIAVVVGKNVRVNRTIAGLPVFGPGSKIKLYIGEKDAIDGFMTLWRQIDLHSTALGHEKKEGKTDPKLVTPIPAADAVALLKKDPLDHLPIALVNKVKVEKIDFGYYARSAVEPQKFFQPVYVFSGTAHAILPNGTESILPYEQYVLAMKDPVEPIWPVDRIIEPNLRAKDEPFPEHGEDERVEK